MAWISQPEKGEGVQPVLHLPRSLLKAWVQVELVDELQRVLMQPRR